ncbi:transposase [Streptomyces sp. NPDC094154]|uniref:transposase n=1 Tax=unclassified Streptomyces TaxID=2593676 RepID=UPI00380B11BE
MEDRGTDTASSATTRERLDTVGTADVAATLQALAAPSRLYSLARIQEGACSVSELAEAVGMEASACSHQLRLLRNLGLTFADLSRRIRRHREAIVNAIIHRLSNGLIESTNTKTRLFIRRGFGFRTADAVIALVMLTLGGDRPTPPARQPASA